MRSCLHIAALILKTAKRDKLLHAIIVVGLLIILFVPAFSLFSMRQVQELSITLATSTLSFVLLVVTLLTGATSIWRDIERKYTNALLGLPLSRQAYLLGKYLGIAAIIGIISILIGCASLVAVKIAAAQYKSDMPILWGTLLVTILFDTLKYLLLLAFALLFSTVSTSFYFSFFSTIAIYLTGMASQEVFEYIHGDYAQKLSSVSLFVVKGLYYLLPNFSAFNLKVYAIYSLKLQLSGLLLTIGYFLVYTALVLCLAVWSFSRRELL